MNASRSKPWPRSSTCWRKRAVCRNGSWMRAGRVYWAAGRAPAKRCLRRRPDRLAGPNWSEAMELLAPDGHAHYRLAVGPTRRARHEAARDRRETPRDEICSLARGRARNRRPLSAELGRGPAVRLSARTSRLGGRPRLLRLQRNSVARAPFRMAYPNAELRLLCQPRRSQRRLAAGRSLFLKAPVRWRRSICRRPDIPTVVYAPAPFQ